MWLLLLFEFGCGTLQCKQSSKREPFKDQPDDGDQEEKKEEEMDYYQYITEQEEKDTDERNTMTYTHMMDHTQAPSS